MNLPANALWLRPDQGTNRLTLPAVPKVARNSLWAWSGIALGGAVVFCNLALVRMGIAVALADVGRPLEVGCIRPGY